MARRINLKDKEITPLLLSDINSMSDGNEIPVYVVSPTAPNAYVLGYNGSTITHFEIPTKIYTHAKELVYTTKQLNQFDSSYNLFLRKYNNDVVLVADYQSTLNFIPPSSVHKVILKQGTYYMGVNGTSFINTTNEDTAKSNVSYHWDVLINSTANATFFSVMLYNRNAGRYLSIANATTTTNATTSYLELYNGNTFFMHSQSMTSGSDMALYLERGTPKTMRANKPQDLIKNSRWWSIISLETSFTNVSTVGWKCPLSFNISTGNTQTGLLAGYNVPFLRFEQQGGYLSHGTSYSSGLSFSTQGTSTNAEWVLYKR